MNIVTPCEDSAIWPSTADKNEAGGADAADVLHPGPRKIAAACVAVLVAIVSIGVMIVRVSDKPPDSVASSPPVHLNSLVPGSPVGRLGFPLCAPTAGPHDGLCAFSLNDPNITFGADVDQCYRLHGNPGTGSQCDTSREFPWPAWYVPAEVQAQRDAERFAAQQAQWDAEAAVRDEACDGWLNDPSKAATCSAYLRFVTEHPGV